MLARTVDTIAARGEGLLLQVNPVTAKRDLDIVAALGRTFGHINMGVYAEVVVGAEIAVGDAMLRV
jgi:hypothetical protein